MAGQAVQQCSSSSDRDRQRWDNQLCILQLSSSFRGDSAFVIQFIISQFFPCAPPDNDWQGFVVQSARSSQSIKQRRLMDRQAGSWVSVPFQRTEQNRARPEWIVTDDGPVLRSLIFIVAVFAHKQPPEVRFVAYTNVSWPEQSHTSTANAAAAAAQDDNHDVHKNNVTFFPN